MARMLTKLASLSLLGLSMTGCVAQEKYNALKLDRDGLVERLAQADAESRAARGEADVLKNQLAMLSGNGNTQAALVQNLHTENAQLQAQLADLNRRYEEAVRNVGTGSVALTPELTNTLEQFAAQNPGLVDFDSARGMVKFRSDLTFATGSADVTEQAKTAIGRFAQILNSPSANGYELMVAGHTDNQRVSNPETIRRGHLDNWYLSSHRAISVGKVLQDQGVNTQRIAVVGYADQRPISDNSSAGGRQQNRRVEVLILPTQARANATLAGARQTGTGAARPAPAGNGLNKDTAPAPAPAPAPVQTPDNK
jgi:chemotaxis protein MotB